MVKRVLILGGTADARELADALAEDPELQVTTSLAGVTSKPALPAGRVRRGGFGGADGLANYLSREQVSLLIDATHPYAVHMSENAAEASRKTSIPCFRLERPAWIAGENDSWEGTDNPRAAANMLPSGARALVTVGRQHIRHFLERRDIAVLARMIEPPDVKPLAPHKIMLTRPPFALEDELLLMRTEHISHLVTKNSGGKMMAPKLEAARSLGLEVIMIERPVLPEVETAGSLEEAVGLVSQMLQPQAQ